MSVILSLHEDVQKVLEDLPEEKQKLILEGNVYELITYDVSFAIVDDLASQLGGYTSTDPRRLAGAVGHVVYSFLRGGSTTWRIAKPVNEYGVIYGYKNGIKEELSLLLLKHDSYFTISNEIEWHRDEHGENVPLLKDGLFNQALHQAVVLFLENGRQVLEINEYNGNKRLIYKPVYWSEIHIANRLRAIMEGKTLIPRDEFKKVIDGLDKRLNDEQRNACVTALNNKVTIITGGAGVGKTFVIESLINSIIDNSHNIRLGVVAPTGRASLNIQESLMENGSEAVRKYMSEHEASTIHRLLKLRASEFKGGARSKFNYKNNPLDVNFVIVDESSMVDTILMNNLLWGLPNDAHIVIVGDPNQLASVGAGQVLYDLTIQLKYGKQFRDLDIDRPKWVHLTEVQRTSLDTNLPFVSRSLLTKDKTERWENFEQEFDKAVGIGSINFIETKNILDTVRDIYLSNRESIILTPRHYGENGGRVDINNTIMSKLGFTGYQVGVPVVQNKTNYNRGVLNGERGVVSKVDRKEDTITVDFEGGNKVEYRIKDVDDELIIGYATTVHKSQGSEADTIIIPIWTVNGKSVWDISLLYTALTRAKLNVYVIGTKADLRLSMNRSRNNHRFTMLPHRYKAKFTN